MFLVQNLLPPLYHSVASAVGQPEGQPPSDEVPCWCTFISTSVPMHVQPCILQSAFYEQAFLREKHGFLIAKLFIVYNLTRNIDIDCSIVEL